MRLDSIREILAGNVDRLVVGSMGVEKNVEISDFHDAIDAIREVESTGMFPLLCRQLLSEHVIVLSAQERIVVSPDTHNRFQARLQDLRNRVKIVLEALNEIVEDRPLECLRVRLPETSDLDTAARLLTDVNKVFNQIVANDYLDGKVSLEGFAQGSSWIDICLGSVAAYHFVAGLVNLYFDIKQRQTQEKAREQMLLGLTLDLQIREAVAKAISTELEEYKSKRMRELLEQHNIPAQDNEFALRTENSLRMLGTLLERGLEIHPSLGAPVEERKLLPDPKRIIEAVKSLSGSNDEKKPDATQ